MNGDATPTQPTANYITIDRSELVPWDRLEPAIRVFTRADDAFLRIDADLTRDQRRNIGR